jgi:hypothetical protein
MNQPEGNKRQLFTVTYTKVARDKHSSLLGPIKSYEENEVLQILLWDSNIELGQKCMNRQGTLTEGEGSVQLTSLLRYLVL